MALIEQIESGYAEILRTLQATAATKMLPELQSSAALSRAAYAYHELIKEFLLAAKSRKELTPQSLRLSRDDGSTYSPDGVLSGINAITTMTLLLLGHQNKWFDADKYLVLPSLAELTEDEIYKAGLTEQLAASWRYWERTEQRCRYFDGALQVSRKDSLPDWAPSGTETLIEYNDICDAECLDYLANHRLNDRLVQSFQEMLLQTNIQAKAAGLSERLRLPPDGLASAQEAHAGISLSEILGYPIAGDHETPCGLRLVEWIRGYAVLQLLAEQHYERLGRDGLIVKLARTELIATLDRLGITGGSAERFVDLASIQASSRDLFDQPLIRVQDGSLLLFGPGILNADPARLTLSAIGNKGEQLSRKGKAFESEMLKFFQDKGFAAKTIRFRVDGSDYEYDMLVPWGDHLFLFECKNRTLSGHNPVAAYYFSLEMAAAVRQVRRLADGLVQHADLVKTRHGIDVTDKVIVPYVLNSLPYADVDEDKEVYVTDASILKRFFQERHIHIIRPYRIRPDAAILHRTQVKSLWSGEKPTPADLVNYLRDPPQLQLAMAHTEANRIGFGLGERTVVAVNDLAYTEITAESISKLFSVDFGWVKREAKTVRSAITKAKRKAAQRAIIEADRAWRTKRRR